MNPAFMMVAAVLAVGEAQPGTQDPAWSYSGAGAARYEDERASAEAMLATGSYRVSCSRGRLTHRSVRGRSVTAGACSARQPLPILERVRVTSNERQLLLVRGPGGGGTIIADDEVRLRAISIPAMTAFGDVLNLNQIVIRTAAGCRELTLDWARRRIARNRPWDGSAPGC